MLFVMFWSDTPLPFALVAITLLVSCAVWTARQSSRLRRQALAYPPLRLLFLWVFGSRVVQNSVRAKVGTVGSHLTDRFAVARIRVHDLWHLHHRLIRKVLAHTVGVFLNLQLGRPPLDLDELLEA